MATMTFDTHAFVKKFKSAGFTEEQAETQVQAISEAMEAKELATKKDSESLHRDLKELELRLRHDLTLRFGGMLAVAVGVIVMLDKVWK